MEVVATKRGYLGKLREPGDTFTVPADAKASWFAPANAAPAQLTAAQAKAAKAQADADAKAAKADADAKAKAGGQGGNDLV